MLKEPTAQQTLDYLSKGTKVVNLTPSTDLLYRDNVVTSWPDIRTEDGRLIHARLVVEQAGPDKGWMQNPEKILKEVVAHLYRGFFGDPPSAE